MAASQIVDAAVQAERPLPVDPFFEIVRVILILLPHPAAIAGQQGFNVVTSILLS